MGKELETLATAKSPAFGELLRRCSELWELTLCRSPSHNAVELWKEHLMLREQLSEINLLQKKLGANEERRVDRREALTAFLDWADRMGIERRGVSIVYDERIGGFGLQATREIQQGDDIVCVPRKAILSWDLARKSSMLKKCIEHDVIARSMTNVALALMVCCQKLLPDSGWQPYFRVLPDSFSTPLYFSPEELQSLRPSPAYEDALLLYRNVARQFVYFLISIMRTDEYRWIKKARNHNDACEPIFLSTPFTSAAFTFNLYCWSVACISTRVNLIPSQEAKDSANEPLAVPSLIPVLDMVNHEFSSKAQADAVYFSAESESAGITAVRDYKMGDKVSIYYGKRSNRDFLLHNGFVPIGENANDSYKLKIGLAKNDKHRDIRLKKLSDIGFSTEAKIFAFEVDASEPYLHPSLIEFCRVFVADDPSEDLRSALVTKKAWAFLRDRFALLMKQYGNIREEANDNCASMVQRLKISELKILIKAEQFCALQLAQL